MENDLILNALKNVKNGQFATLEKEKVFENGYRKVSYIEYRKGINYSHMACNNGKTTGSLPWGHWVSGLENVVIEHKGSYYLRISAVDSNGVRVLDTKYFNDSGVEIDKATMESVVGASKLTSKPSAVYNVKFENITKIGK